MLSTDPLLDATFPYLDPEKSVGHGSGVFPAYFGGKVPIRVSTPNRSRVNDRDGRRKCEATSRQTPIAPQSGPTVKSTTNRTGSTHPEHLVIADQIRSGTIRSDPIRSVPTGPSGRRPVLGVHGADSEGLVRGASTTLNCTRWPRTCPVPHRHIGDDDAWTDDGDTADAVTKPCLTTRSRLCTTPRPTIRPRPPTRQTGSPATRSSGPEWPPTS